MRGGRGMRVLPWRDKSEAMIPRVLRIMIMWGGHGGGGVLCRERVRKIWFDLIQMWLKWIRLGFI